MQIIQRTGEILREVEASLVRLANAASTDRDYDGASQVLGVAREIKRLAARISSDDPNSNLQPNGSDSPRRKQNDFQENGIPPRIHHRLGQYPRFERSGDRLVKIGWSKKDKTEYEHKCPKHVLLSLTSALEAAGREGRRFTMDKVLPLLIDPSDGSELPSYQCYVALAWLRTVGLVVQHGRQGYSLAGDSDLQAEAEDCWNRLPPR